MKTRKMGGELKGTVPHKREEGWIHSTVTFTYTVTERMNFVLPQGLSI